ncbi:MAG TPA: pseudouridine synthase [Vicinamibacteria bacterium]|nr:pseudouridine synthase [Vicinamibacteria bacterium]
MTAARARGPLSLARALSKFGVCSRSEAVRRIAAGRVTLNGRVVTRPETRLDPRRDRVCVDGAPVEDETESVVLALNKPPGYVTTRSDPAGRPTVYDLVGKAERWVFPVGRLDRDSSGLLLLTNDHRLGERLTSPAAHVPKTYHARVRGLPDAAALRVLREGVPLEDGLTRRARVRALGAARDGTTWLEIVLTEGKNRQVRRMCAAVGHDVVELVRVRVGSLALGDLPSGGWRRLGPDEVSRLLDRSTL